MQTFFFLVLGLFAGILINLTADWLPRRSETSPWRVPHCSSCGKPRPLGEWIALMGLLRNKRRCPHCNAPRPLRDPLVELVSLLAFGFLWLRFGPTVYMVLTLIHTVIFLLVLVVDFEHRLIFNVVILPATLLAFLAGFLSPLGPVRSILGGIIAYLIVFAIYEFARVFARLRRHTLAVPFGFGDVKLAGYMGLVTAFPDVFPALFLAILLGGAGAILFLGYQVIVHHRLPLGAAIPYGPFFCLAGWALMVMHPA